MNCPQCGAETVVIDSRPALGTVRRRRECTACGYRFTTREVTQDQWERVRMSDKAIARYRKLARALHDVIVHVETDV